METKTMNDYKTLCDLVNKYSYHYYVLSSPLIGDAEFDVLYKELESIEAQHPEWVTSDSPTQKVGSDLKVDADKVLHARPMLSLDKVHTMHELEDFISYAQRETDKDVTLYADHKYDGVSLSIIYIGGILAKAVTRGDGNGGQDVTRNVVEILSIPKDIRSQMLTQSKSFGVLPEVLEVRGEVLMTKAAFATYNNGCHKYGRTEYCNERSAASGLLLGSSPSACKMLTFMAWNVFTENDNDFSTHSGAMNYLSALGFKTGGGWRMEDSIQIERFLNQVQLTREQLKCPIDGVVFKVDERGYWDKLGSTQKHPRWAMAFKYKTDEYTTIVRDLVWSVSDNTGRITPVVVYDEVVINGTKCTRADMHSYNNFLTKMNGIHKGDFLIVTLSNECVPAVVRWGVGAERTTQLVPPLKCPVCGETLIVDGKHLVCPRPDKHETARKMKAEEEEKKRLAERPTEFNKFALLGKKVVVTGTYVRFTEDEIKELVVRCGGKKTSTVSGATDILVAGTNPGPSKMAKAAAYGTRVINEDEFLRMIIK